MALDWNLALAGLLVGTVIGLTGMGGGALMTPVLVLLFGVPPSVAVSSDIMTSLLMKPVGAAVHLRRGTVHLKTVRALVIGSVPAAFLGAAAFYRLNRIEQAEQWMQRLLGVTLLVAAAAMALKLAFLQRPGESEEEAPLQVSPVRTMVVGAIGGVIVGLTSVGSGSLILVLLMLLHPGLSAARLVGTDLVQAIPLVGAAALGHAIFGEVHVGILTSLLLGSLPGVYFGAKLSAHAPDRWIRPVLLVVLFASALKLLGVGTDAVAAATVLLVALALAFSLLQSRGPRPEAPSVGK